MIPRTMRKHASYIPPTAVTALFRSSSSNLQTTTACSKPLRPRPGHGTWRSILRRKTCFGRYPTGSPHRRRPLKTLIPGAMSYPERSAFLSLACKNHIGRSDAVLEPGPIADQWRDGGGRVRGEDPHRGKNRTLRDSMSVPQLVFLPRAEIAGNAAIFSPR